MVDNKIYTFGGFVSGNSALRSWEVYALDTDTWEYPYGSWMTSNRAHLTSAVLSGENLSYRRLYHSRRGVQH